jgi:hypothetical protein
MLPLLLPAPFEFDWPLLATVCCVVAVFKERNVGGDVDDDEDDVDDVDTVDIGESISICCRPFAVVLLA